MDCVAHNVFQRVDHPLVELEDLTPLTLGEFVQAAAARVAEKHMGRLRCACVRLWGVGDWQLWCCG